MKKTLIAILALILIGSGTVSAQPGKGMDHPMPGMMPPGHPMVPMGMDDDDDDNEMRGCMGGIEFTAEQRTKLDKMRLEGQKIRLEKKAQMVDLQTKLKLALTSEKLNQKEIDEIAAKMGKFHQDGVLMKTKHVREVRDMLTPEQRIKFDQRILSCSMMGPGMKGPGSGRGHGMGMGHDCKSDNDDCKMMEKRHGRDCD